MKLHDLSELLSSSVFTQALPIVNACHARGATAYLVGGAVRDALMGIVLPEQDIDIEVFGLTLDELQEILALFGPVRLTGKQFAVLRLDTMPIDWSIPRRDSIGRKPQVTLDSSMSVSQALKRRDLTINALAYDIKRGTLHDPYGGIEDIQNRRARYVDEELFGQDPLRVLRVMQFIARFDLTAEPALTTRCARMSLEGVSHERICQEYTKMFLKSERPAQGLRWLHETGHDQQLLPELYALAQTPQEPSWHPEGHVLEHAWQTLDAAAALIHDVTPSVRIALLYAALLHDVGKAATTRYIKGTWRALGHDRVGALMVPACLRRMTMSKEYDQMVSKLVYYHMAPPHYIKNGAKDAAYKRLAYHLAPYADAYQLAHVSWADRLGRNPARGRPWGIAEHAVPEVTLFIQRMESLGVLYAPEPPRVTGTLLMQHAPLQGPIIGRLLHAAYDLQLKHPEWSRDRIIREILTQKDEMKNKV